MHNIKVNKMRKLILVTFALAFLQVLGFAQKPIKENLKKYQYTQLPNTPLPKEYKNYMVISSSSTSYREDIINNAFNIAGYTKVEDANNDFKIRVKEQEIIFSDAERKDEKKVYKKDGVEKTYYEYHFEFKVTHKVSADVFHSKSGEKITDFEIFDNGKVLKSKVSKSSKDAFDIYKKYKSSLKNSLLTDKLASINHVFNERIGFPVKGDFLHLYKVKPKKHKYNDYDEALEVAMQGADIVIANENDIEKAKPHFNKAIELWNVALKESDVDNKKARINKKVTALTHYNIAMCQFLMKDYEACIAAMEKATDAVRGFSNARHYIDKATELLKRVEANKAL